MIEMQSIFKVGDFVVWQPCNDNYLERFLEDDVGVVIKLTRFSVDYRQNEEDEDKFLDLAIPESDFCRYCFVHVFWLKEGRVLSHSECYLQKYEPKFIPKKRK